MLIDFELLIKSFIVGFVIATPIGAASILCMRRLLIKGPLAGLVSALGISTADAIYTAFATFGLSAVSGFIMNHQPLIRVGGGALLLLWGIKLLLKKQPKTFCRLTETKYLKSFGTTFFLTLSNPMIIMFMATILTSIGIRETPGTLIDALTLLGCVFAGSISWWIIIIGIMIFFRYRPTPSILDNTNKISGGLLLFIGSSFALKGIIKFFFS